MYLDGVTESEGETKIDIPFKGQFPNEVSGRAKTRRQQLHSATWTIFELFPGRAVTHWLGNGGAGIQIGTLLWDTNVTIRVLGHCVKKDPFSSFFDPSLVSTFKPGSQQKNNKTVPWSWRTWRLPHTTIIYTKIEALNHPGWNWTIIISLGWSCLHTTKAVGGGDWVQILISLGFLFIVLSALGSPKACVTI